MKTRTSRLARAGVASVVATFVAAFSHVVAGGALPSIAATALSLAFSTIVCISLVSSTVSLWRTSMAVLASQLVYHGVFSAMTDGAAFASYGGADHEHGVMSLVVLQGATSVTADASWMWVGHGIAAGVTIAAIRRAELAWRGIHSTALFLTGLVIAVFPRAMTASISMSPLAHRSILPAWVAPRREPGVLFATMRHRGPPRAA